MARSHRLSRHVAVVRIVFGLIWAVDAALKWTPAFRASFVDQIQAAASGQPGWLQWWFGFWLHFLSLQPDLFAWLVTVTESLIALALLFGFLRQITYILAAVFSFMIWAIPEGFGGPYTGDATDIGTGIIYAIVFLSLFGLERLAGPSSWSLDTWIAKRLTWWHRLADPPEA